MGCGELNQQCDIPGAQWSCVGPGCLVSADSLGCGESNQHLDKQGAHEKYLQLDVHVVIAKTGKRSMKQGCSQAVKFFFWYLFVWDLDRWKPGPRVLLSLGLTSSLLLCIVPKGTSELTLISSAVVFQAQGNV